MCNQLFLPIINLEVMVESFFKKLYPKIGFRFFFFLKKTKHLVKKQTCAIQ